MRAGGAATLKGKARRDRRSEGRPYRYDPGCCGPSCSTSTASWSTTSRSTWSSFSGCSREEGISLPADGVLRPLPGAGRPRLLRGGARRGRGGGHRPPPDAADRAQGELLPGARPPRGVSFLPGRGRSWCASSRRRRRMLGVVSGALREEVEGALRQAASARPFQGADHRRGRERGQAEPRGVPAGPGGAQLAAAPARAPVPSPRGARRRGQPGRASPPPPRSGSPRWASPTPIPAHRLRGADAVVASLQRADARSAWSGSCRGQPALRPLIGRCAPRSLRRRYGRRRSTARGTASSSSRRRCPNRPARAPLTSQPRAVISRVQARTIRSWASSISSRRASSSSRLPRCRPGLRSAASRPPSDRAPGGRC